MKYRFLALAFLILLPIPMAWFPHVHANYRLNPTVSDTWPSYGPGFGLVTAVKLANATGTSQPLNIITGGTYNNGSSYAQLRIYHKASNALSLDLNQLWPRPAVNSYYVSGVEVADIDGNGQNDIIFTSNIQPVANQPPTGSQLGIYRWNGLTLTKEYLKNFTGPSNVIETRSVAIYTYQGIHQIVTIGYYRTGGTDYSQLGIWSFDGSNLTKNSLWNWTTTGSTGAGAQGYSVATGDVDNDGIPDIVTAGFSNNGTLTQTQVRVWQWTGSGTPQLKQYRDWYTTGQASVGTFVSIQDLSGNGQREIVVGGQILSFPFWRAELSVWSDWTGSLTQLADTNWATSSQSSADLIRVAAGDVDGNGTVEIVTAGYTNEPVGATDVFYGTIRIWAWSGSSITLQKSYLNPTSASLLNAVTIGDIDKTGKQDIIVGGQQAGRGLVEVRDVAFVSTTLSLTWSGAIQAGQSVSFLGSLTNSTDSAGIPSAQVLVEYASGSGATSGFQILTQAITDSQGRFGFTWAPSAPGPYTIRTSWNGDENHLGTSKSADISIGKVPSVIVLSCSSLSVKPGDTITINGYVYPTTSTNVTMTYTGPNNSPISHTVKANANGYFTDTLVVNEAGVWTVSAAWTGSSGLGPATSNTLSVQAQPDPLGVTLSLYSFILAIVALGVGGSLFAVFRKRNISQNPSNTPATTKP
ncbi:hypothetical protein E6H29_11000 [Candidatus Bathyarchaeota archaeon]|nr:MAG: hypothetical protein E6H29_11000 [Candidatus Bathyarchaeota archaeon]